jgi:hypothetical protein
MDRPFEFDNPWGDASPLGLHLALVLLAHIDALDDHFLFFRENANDFSAFPFIDFTA